MLLLGIVYAVGLQLIGLEVGLIIGMIAGLASIIPYLGFAVGIIAAVIATLFQFGLNFIQLGGVVILIPIISYYFLLDWERMLQSFRRLIPRPYEASTLRIVGECHSVLGAFVKGQFLVMLLLGIVYAVLIIVSGKQIGRAHV